MLKLIQDLGDVRDSLDEIAAMVAFMAEAVPVMTDSIPNERISFGYQQIMHRIEGEIDHVSNCVGVMQDEKKPVKKTKRD